MEVPVIINGEERGRLRAVKDGLYTVLEAEVPGDSGALIRLWAHGEGKSAYLGVLQPWSNGLWLRRRLSRRELAAFPMPIAFASDRERENENEESLHNIESADQAPSPQQDPEPRRETDAHSCPWPAEPPKEGLLWYRRGDGSLVSFDGISSLVAIPAELRASGLRAVERVIEGKKYLVFRY